MAVREKALRIFPSTIGSKLVSLFLLLSLLPLVLVTVMTNLASQEELRSHIGDGFSEVSSQTLDKIDRLLFESKENIKTWVAIAAPQDVVTGDPNGRIAESLVELKRGYGVYSLIVCVNPQGQVIASSNPEVKGQDVAQRPWFQDIVKTRRVSIGDLAYEKLAGGFAVRVAAPIVAAHDETQVIGFLCSWLNWSELFELTNAVHVTATGQSESGYAVLINKTGFVISGPAFLFGEEEAVDVLSRRNLLAGGFQSARLALQGQRGFQIETDPNGKQWLVGYAGSKGYRDFRGLGWAVLILQQTHEAFAPIRTLRNQFVGIGFAVGCVVLILALLTARGISAPIRRLTKAAEAVAKGDLTQVVDVGPRDEVGILANTFNVMTENLRQSREELVFSKSYIENIIKGMLDSLLVVDLEGRIQSLNPSTTALLGYTAEELIERPLATLFAEGSPFRKLGLDVSVQQKFIGSIEEALVSKDGRDIPVLVSASFMRDATGKAQGIICAVRDMTELKQAEEEMKKKNQELKMMNEIMMGREERILELKEEINRLLEELNRPKKYGV